MNVRLPIFFFLLVFVLCPVPGCSKMTAEEAGLYLAVPPNRPPSSTPGKTLNKKVHYSISSGTGFFITSDGVLVTNYHVIKDAEAIAIYHNGDFVDARMLGADSTNDLAVLKVPVSASPAPLATSFRGKRGEEVFTLGYPISTIQGWEQKALFGHINAQSGMGDDIRYTQIDIPIHPGNSGGPLINDTGTVTGVITLTLSSHLLEKGIIPQNVGYAMKIDYVWPLLRKLGITPSAKPDLTRRSMPSLVAALEKSVVQIYTLVYP